MTKLQLILADDDDGFRALLADVLEEAGFVVLKAATGLQFLQHCQRHRVAVAILDLAICKKEGLDLVSEFRQRFSGIPTIAICGSHRGGLDQCLQLARQIQADAILTKPFGTAEILHAIRQVAAQRPAQAPT